MSGMEQRLQELKRRFLKLLDEDVEFRYTVAGYLGLSEILKRLDGIEAEQLRMREEFSKRFEAHERELIALRVDLKALREDFNRMQETIERMQETIERMQKTIEGILGRLEQLDKRLTRVERTLEKLTLDIEEEARSVVAHRLKQMGYEIAIDRLHLPGLELNLYGASGDVCVVGEASVRAGPALLEELKRKLDAVKKRYPGLLRPKTVMVIYASWALPELVEAAKQEGVWILKATGDITPPPEL